MDAMKIMDLLDLIEKAEVLPPDTGDDPEGYATIVARRQAIITKAEADIDAEVAIP